MTALARATSNCKRQTRPLVREDAPQQQTRNCLTVTKIWSRVLDWCLTPRQTGRLTIGRHITLTLTSRTDVKKHFNVSLLSLCFVLLVYVFREDSSFRALHPSNLKLP
jgi:hypothetical protein